MFNKSELGAFSIYCSGWGVGIREQAKIISGSPGDALIVIFRILRGFFIKE
jgi:hypothetical protein